MNRRGFLNLLASIPVVGPIFARWQHEPVEEPVKLLPVEPYWVLNEEWIGSADGCECPLCGSQEWVDYFLRFTDICPNTDGEIPDSIWDEFVSLYPQFRSMT